MNRPASQNWVPDDPCQVTICRLIALSIVVHQRPDCCPQGDQARYQRLLQPLIVSSGMVTRFCTLPPPIIIKAFSDDVFGTGRDSSNSLIFLLINTMEKLMHTDEKNILLVEIFLTFLIFLTGSPVTRGEGPFSFLFWRRHIQNSHSKHWKEDCIGRLW